MFGLGAYFFLICGGRSTENREREREPVINSQAITFFAKKTYPKTLLWKRVKKTSSIFCIPYAYVRNYIAKKAVVVE